MFMNIRMLRNQGKRIEASNRETCRKVSGHLFIAPDKNAGSVTVAARLYWDQNRHREPIATLYEPKIHEMTAHGFMLFGYEISEINGIETTVFQVWECSS